MHEGGEIMTYRILLTPVSLETLLVDEDPINPSVTMLQSPFWMHAHSLSVKSVGYGLRVAMAASPVKPLLRGVHFGNVCRSTAGHTGILPDAGMRGHPFAWAGVLAWTPSSINRSQTKSNLFPITQFA